MKTTFIVVLAITLLVTSAHATDSKKDDAKDPLQAEDSKTVAVETKKGSLKAEETKAEPSIDKGTKESLHVEETKKVSVSVAKEPLKVEGSEEKGEDSLEGQETRRIDGDPPHPAPEPYQFGFETKDPKAGEQFRQEDGNKQGVVRGSYGFRTPQGIFRVVDYIADSLGFRANIRSNEPGLAKQAPNHINVEKPEGDAIVEDGPKAPLLPPPPPPPASAFVENEQKYLPDDGVVDYGTRLTPSSPRERPFIEDSGNPPPPPPHVHVRPLSIDEPKGIRVFGSAGADIPPGGITGSEGKGVAGDFDLPPRVTVVHHEESYDKRPEPAIGLSKDIAPIGYKKFANDAPPYRDQIIEKDVPPPLAKAYDDEVVSVNEAPLKFKQHSFQKSIPPPPDDYIEEQIPVKSGPPPPPPSYKETGFVSSRDIGIPPRVTVIHHNTHYTGIADPVAEKHIPAVIGAGHLPPIENDGRQFGDVFVGKGPSTLVDPGKSFIPPSVSSYDYPKGELYIKSQQRLPPNDGKDFNSDLDIPPRVTVIHHGSSYDEFSKPGLQTGIGPASLGDGRDIEGKGVPLSPGQYSPEGPLHSKNFNGDLDIPPRVSVVHHGSSYDEFSKPGLQTGIGSADLGNGRDIEGKGVPLSPGQYSPEGPLHGKNFNSDLDIPPRVTVVHHGSSYDDFSKPGLQRGIGSADLGSGRDIEGKGVPLSPGQYNPEGPLPGKNFNGDLDIPPRVSVVHHGSSYDDFSKPGLQTGIGSADLGNGRDIEGKGVPLSPGQYNPEGPLPGKNFNGDLDIPPRVSVVHHGSSYDDFSKPGLQTGIGSADLGNGRDIDGKRIPLSVGQYSPEKPLLPESNYKEGGIDDNLPPSSYGKDEPLRVIPGGLDIPPRVTVIHHGSHYNTFNDPKFHKGLTISDAGKGSPFSGEFVGGKDGPPRDYDERDNIALERPPPPPPDYDTEKFPEKSLPPHSVGKEFVRELDIPPRVTLIHHGVRGNLGSFQNGPPLRDYDNGNTEIKGPPQSSIVGYQSGNKFSLPITSYGGHRHFGYKEPCPPYLHTHEQQKGYPLGDYRGEDEVKSLPPTFNGKDFDRDRDVPPRVSVIHHNEQYNKGTGPDTFPHAQRDKEFFPPGGSFGEEIVSKGAPHGGYGATDSLPPPPPPPSGNYEDKYVDIKGPPRDYDDKVSGKGLPPYSDYDGPGKELPPPPPPPKQYLGRDYYGKDSDLPPRVTVIHHNKGPGSITTFRYGRYGGKDLLYPEFNYGGFRGRPLNYHIEDERPRFVGPHYGSRHLYPFNFGGPRALAIGVVGRNHDGPPFGKHFEPYYPRHQFDGVKSIHRDVPREPPRIIKVVKPYGRPYNPVDQPDIKPKGLKIIALKSAGPPPEATKPKTKVVNVVSLLVALRPDKCQSVCG